MIVKKIVITITETRDDDGPQIDLACEYKVGEPPPEAVPEEITTVSTDKEASVHMADIVTAVGMAACQDAIMRYGGKITEAEVITSKLIT